MRLLYYVNELNYEAIRYNYSLNAIDKSVSIAEKCLILTDR